MAPAPDNRVPDHHEAGNLVDGIVLPLRFEDRAVAAFVPTAVTARTVENAVNKKERDAPERAPEIGPQRCGDDHQADPEDCVARGGAVAAFHELLHPRARNGRFVPFRIGEPRLNRLRVQWASEAVITRVLCRCHGTSSK